MKAISELNKKEGIADYEYYKDKTGYYYDLKVPFYKKRFAKWIAGREIKNSWRTNNRILFSHF